MNNHSCVVCWEDFQPLPSRSKDRRPVQSRRCEHSICAECCRNLPCQRNSRAKCPICREQHAFSSRGIPVNRLACELIASIRDFSDLKSQLASAETKMQEEPAASNDEILLVQRSMKDEIALLRDKLLRQEVDIQSLLGTRGHGWWSGIKDEVYACVEEKFETLACCSIVFLSTLLLWSYSSSFQAWVVCLR